MCHPIPVMIPVNRFSSQLRNELILPVSQPRFLTNRLPVATQNSQMTICGKKTQRRNPKRALLRCRGKGWFMQEINVKLWRNHQQQDWSIEINGTRYESVTI